MNRLRMKRAWMAAVIAGGWFGAMGWAGAQETPATKTQSVAVVAAKTLTGGVPRVVESDGESITVRTILVRPREATTSLESPLFPSRDKLQRGAAAPIFLRQNFEATHALKTLRETYQRGDAFKSLEELDVAAARTGTPLRLSELRRAAFREHAGWEYPLGEERAAYILLPDVQESRLYSQALVLSARADIKEGKLADATDKICIALGLAKHVGETPFAVCRLVQKSQVDGALFAVEELLQHPSGANHYWSLAALPRPLIPVLDVLQMESKMAAATFPALANLDSRLTEAEWERMAGEVVEMIRLSSPAPLPRASTPEADEVLKQWVRRSRERLPQIRPEWRERIAQMSDVEVELRYWFERCRDREKRHLAWAALEPSAALSRLLASEAELAKDAADEPPVRHTMAEAGASLVRASTLLEQRIALLRTIEAIRDWSARHGGKLPGSLAEVDLPTPRDPVVDAPFTYVAAADGKSATLAGALVESKRAGAAEGKPVGKSGYRYELKIAE